MSNLKLGIVVTKIESEQQPNGGHKINMPEPIFYMELAYLAATYGIDLFIFSSMEWNDGDLFGYRWLNNEWQRQHVPMPDILYDRCFHTSPKQRHASELMLDALRRKKAYISFNSPLPNKLIVYEALQKVEELIPYLPYTETLLKLSSVSRWLKLYPDGVILKPAAGMHGKGVLHIVYNEEQAQFEVRGRNLRNVSFRANFMSELNLLKWLYHFKRDLSYLIQPYLHLKINEDRPFDIRVLMQKDFSGQWQLSGSVARVGEAAGLTSNLHGGGQAYAPMLLLSEKLGSYKAERLLQKLHMISGQTVTEIEAHFGRFGELALDFGISPQGSIWLLECNSKPGRQAFVNYVKNTDSISTISNDSEIYGTTLTLERPLQYAQYLQHRHATSQKVI